MELNKPDLLLKELKDSSFLPAFNVRLHHEGRPHQEAYLGLLHDGEADGSAQAKVRRSKQSDEQENPSDRDNRYYVCYLSTLLINIKRIIRCILAYMYERCDQ